MEREETELEEEEEIGGEEVDEDVVEEEVKEVGKGEQKDNEEGGKWFHG